VVILNGLVTYPNTMASLVIQSGASPWASLTLGSGVQLEVGQVTIQNDAVLNLKGDGTFKAGSVLIEPGTGSLPVQLNLSGSVTLESAGAVTITTGAGLTFSGTGTVGAGSMDVQAGGTLNIDNLTLGINSGNVTSAGTITSTGGTIAITGGDFTQSGGSISGPVTISAGGDVTQSGGAAMSGDITISAGGPIGIDLQGTNTLDSANLTASNGDIELNNVSGSGLSLTASAPGSGKTITVTENGTLSVTAAGITAGGDVTLNASGGAITAAGPVSSTGGAVDMNAGGTGTISLGANISAGGNITFHDAVTLSADATVTSSAGNVEFNNTVDGNHSLGVEASGTVTFGSTVGNVSTPLATLKVKADDFVISNTVRAGTIRIEGTGPLTVGGSGSPLLDPTEFGYLTASTRMELAAGSSLSITVNVTAPSGGLLLDAGGGLTQSGGSISGTVTVNAGGDVTQSGGAVMSGDITIDARGPAGIALPEANTLSSANLTASNGNIELNNASGGTLSLEAHAHGIINVTQDNSIIVTSGLSAGGDVTLNATAGAITATGAVSSTGGAVDMSAGGAMTLGAAVSAATTVDLSAPGGIGLGAVTAGGNITLTAPGGAITATGAVSSTGGAVVLTAGGTGTIGLASVNAGGNVTLAAPGGAITTAGAVSSTGGAVDMSAPGGIGLGASVSAGGNITFHDTVRLSASATVTSDTGSVAFRGNLDIPAFSMTVNCPSSLPVSISGNVILGGTLFAGPNGNSTLTIEVGGNWTQTGTFHPQAGTVSFTGTPVEIDGPTTTWYNLKFTASSPEIKFRNYPFPRYDPTPPYGHYIRGVFQANARAVLTRLTPVGANDAADASALPASALFYDELSGNHADKFWNLFYDPAQTTVFDALGQAQAAMNWCWVRPTISRSMNLPDIGEWELPYVPSSPASRYNVGWIAPYFVYSYTEDWDHNGRIDHIRVQSSAPMNLNFQDFEARVDAYTVTGYEFLPSGSPFRDYIFYIRLKEGDHADTDQTPAWDIINPGKLADTGGRPFALLDSAKRPIDTAPPQVVYSLALPEGNEIFFRLSEPAFFDSSFNPAGSVSVNGVGGSYAVEPVTTAPSGAWIEFKLTQVAPSSLGTADIALEKRLEFASSPQGYFFDSPAPFNYPPLIGSSQLPDCYLIWPKDRTYGYGRTGGNYADMAGMIAWSGSVTSLQEPNYNVNNGGSVCDYTRRISDVLIAPPPVHAAAPFFVQPVYAHDYTGMMNTGSRIFEFDGSRQLLNMDVTIQAKLSAPVAALPSIGGLELRAASDRRIPAEFRASAEQHGIEGLWLPGPQAPGLAPYPYGEALSSAGDPAPGGGLYNFTIPRSALRIGEVMEFYFHPLGASPDLFVARLDTLAGASLPWFRRIKPFAFRVRELIRQRGAVTILNNVINPSRGGEYAVLYYLLDRGGRVTVQVFTMDGTLVRVLEQSGKEAGDYVVNWDGKNNGGRPVARGLYFIRIVAPDIDEIRKVMVVR
jgi:hypothetical protein